MNSFTKLAIILVFLSGAISCGSKPGWTGDELALIQQDSTQMRVLKITDPEDSVILRMKSEAIPVNLLGDSAWTSLSARMIETVRNGEDPGVGIAGPQVGISRKVVAVQRFDKEGEPFEIYPNISILERRGERKTGPEGCLSVPDVRGEVLRNQEITIQYTSLKTLRDTVETVSGFSAVIFQHECDHLDGIIFTDRIQTPSQL